MSKKSEKKDELDTETTFADMNVEGFRWYNPNLKKDKKDRIKLTRKEYWSMVKGAFLALFPFLIILIISFAVVYLLAYLWLS